MRRRSVLGSAAALAVVSAASRAQAPRLESFKAHLPPRPEGTDPWPKAAFEATSLPDILARLGVNNAQDGAPVLLEVPDIAGQPQPIDVQIETTLAKVDQVAVLADRLPFPLLALLRPPPAPVLRLRLTVHLPRTSRVYAYLQSEGRWYGVSREVKVATARG